MTKAEIIMSKLAGLKMSPSAIAYVARQKAEQLKQVIKSPDDYSRFLRQDQKAKFWADKALKLRPKNA